MARHQRIERREQHGAGASGVYEFFCLRGKPGLQFDDLFEGGVGHWRVKPECAHMVEHHKVIKNKWTKRGLSAILHNFLHEHAGGPFVPPAIDGGTATKNPLAAFFVMADAPGKPGDARVAWNESDGAADTRIPALGSTAGEGRRSILISDTAGPGLKRVSIAYFPTSGNPYREIEYVFFAQANTPSYASGQVVVQDGATVVDGATATLNDGLNPQLVFRLYKTTPITEWDGDPLNPIDVLFLAGDAQVDVRNKLLAKINEILPGVGSTPTDGRLNITASAGAGAGDIDLDHDTGGVIGDQTVGVSGAGMAKTDMTGGGGALEIGDDSTLFGYIDNLPIKSIGLAAGRACSSGEADNQVGVRATLGLAPTFQAFSDRIYVHQGAGLHLYAGGEDVDTQGDGYVESGNEAVVDRTIAVHANDHIEADDESIFLENGDLSKADEGRTITFVGATNNAGDHYIQKVITKKRAILASAITLDDNGTWTSTTIKDLNIGAHAFDGDINAEGVTGLVNWGQKWRSVDSGGPHILGRVFGAALSDQITGIRIVGPAGVPKDNFPQAFTIQYLNSDLAGSPPGSAPGDLTQLEPTDDNHWTTIDSPLSSQATNIFDGGEYGYEYLFATPPPTAKCFGIRFFGMTAQDSVKAVEIGELVIFTTRGVITLVAGSNDKLTFATDQAPTGPGVPNGSPGTLRPYNLGNVTTTGVASNEDMQTVVDAINKQTRAREIEALRSELGFLWVRMTVAGDETQMDLAAVGADGANDDVGLPSAATSKVGTTQKLLKLPLQALSAIYRANISGDLPVP
jgi:hypothetical protein